MDGTELKWALNLIHENAQGQFPGIPKPPLAEFQTFAHGHIRARALACYYTGDKCIYYSGDAFREMSDALAIETLIHEYSHHVAWSLFRDARHGKVWKRIAVQLGHPAPKAKVIVPYAVAYAVLRSLTKGR